MAKSVSLLFGVHAHQPVGNFPQVLDQVHERCYRPFLQMLHNYPEFKFAVHFSGWLLDYLIEKYPRDMEVLKSMVERGQVELFGGGYAEPVLAAIPARDRVGQLHAMSDGLESAFGQRPRGAWLTERVWEATVVPALANSGIEYATVDDYHFLCMGKTPAALDGYYTTKEDGRRLDLFPISEALRYRFPFSPAADAVRYVESLASEDGAHAAVYFDDIEKFGIWPETYEWVYEKGWLVNFIEGVLASPVIQTRLYREYHAHARTRGIIYLPTTSYIEMNEWTLPAAAANAYEELVQSAKNSGQFERGKAFVRGGIWKNFLARYPEANWMHKRMEELSARFAALPERARTGGMRQKLYEAQANDAYWHGLFGGLYMPHLRRAVYNALVALERMLDAQAPRPHLLAEDLDLDGVEETFLQNGMVQAVVRMDGMASVIEFDGYELDHNFGDTLRRQTEHYYRKIAGGRAEVHRTEGIASAHDRMDFKHEITPDDLVPDKSQRSLFLDSWRTNGAPAPISVYQAVAGDGCLFRASLSAGEVEKLITVDGKELTVSYRFDGNATGRFMTTLNLALPSCDGWGGRYIHRGNVPGGFGQALAIEGLSEITLEDDTLGGGLILRLSRPAQFRGAPHFTVSQSEAGFEKVMQALTLTLEWPVAGGEITVGLEIVKK